MNSLGSSREIVQNKLIILYILDRLNMPVRNNSITKLVLETHLMNYFMFQQCLNELYEGKLLALNDFSGNSDGYENQDNPENQDDPKRPEGTKRPEEPEGFALTATGRNTLQYFLNLIPPGLKKQIDKMLPVARKEIQSEALVTADFMPESESKFILTCKMGEQGFPLMELKAAVGTKKDARAVCENWKNYSSEIYAEIIEALTKKRIN